MDIYIVLALLCVTSASCIFLGHAAGYGKGKTVGYKQGLKYGLNMVGGYTYRDTDSMKEKS